MSLKKIQQVKKDKGFKIFDLIIYGIIAFTVAVLFIAIFATRNTDSITGVQITVKAQTVFEYEFGGKPVYTEEVEVKEDSAGLTVTVHTEGDGINVIYIDKTAKSVKVTDANCKGKQCVYFSPIVNNSQLIYCNPHGLKIEPLKEVKDDPDIIM